MSPTARVTATLVSAALLFAFAPLLCSNSSEADLRDIFKKFGPVRDVYMPVDFVSRRPRGFAFLEFEDDRDALDAQREMDRMMLDGREIEVVFAQQKRKTPEQMRAVDPRDRRDYGRDDDRDRRRRDDYDRDRRRSRSRSRSRDRDRYRRRSPSPRDRGDRDRYRRRSPSPYSRRRSVSRSPRRESDRRRRSGSRSPPPRRGRDDDRDAPQSRGGERDKDRDVPPAAVEGAAVATHADDDAARGRSGSAGWTAAPAGEAAEAAGAEQA